MVDRVGRHGRGAGPGVRAAAATVGLAALAWPLGCGLAAADEGSSPPGASESSVSGPAHPGKGAVATRTERTGRTGGSHSGGPSASTASSAPAASRTEAQKARRQVLAPAGLSVAPAVPAAVSSPAAASSAPAVTASRLPAPAALPASVGKFPRLAQGLQK